MRWLEVRIDTNHAGLEPVEIFLSARGIDDIIINDEGEFQEFARENRPCWDEVDDRLIARERGCSRITFYLEENEAGFETLAELRVALSSFKKEHADCGPLLMTLGSLENADWENNWKPYYRPMEIGERLIVVPAWEKARFGDRIPLILDPGLAFGTGSHATTRLCLTVLERAIHGGEEVLDLGCGSGILAIAALKLGARHVLACDIDPRCQNVVRENAELNGLDEDVLAFRCGDPMADETLRRELGGGYDLVLANIVSDVILALIPHLDALLRPGGLLICSGIIDTRAEEVADRLRAGELSILETRQADGWFCYVCRSSRKPESR
ncbi:MAG: 50S ribosomal protein L11 methyltransferase [Oscillibacter sp.]|jgi:ribosomal protein L11 methyltransferase|nr:50S ribosomal protein L11 methyltransferase [Oscillibacter sp.]